MKKLLLVVAAMLVLILPSACSLNRQTPKSMDNSAMEAEVRKNLLEDGITGLEVKVDNGTVTLDGHADNTKQKDTAGGDAKKVNGVRRVINNIHIM
ncbi:MAG TPA: BON domain-containing protein [Thermoanaerobaculia bacterium]|nr:BON domain-containing protein [Thermoanaerobaculia bacterium]